MSIKEGDIKCLTCSPGEPLLSTLEEVHWLAAVPLADFEDQKGSAREKYKIFLACAKSKYNAIAKDEDDKKYPAEGEIFVKATVPCLPDVEAMSQISNDVGGGLGLALIDDVSSSPFVL
jgi:hypothetical protein